MTKFIKEPARETRVFSETDVLVIGGGPAGIMAALAAAEEGRKVTLVESRSFVGGNMTIGLPVLGFLSQKKVQIIKGLPQKFIDRLRAQDGASEHRPCPLHMSITLVEPEAVKNVALEMLVEHGVRILLYTNFIEIIKNGNRIEGIITESKAGREAILAKIVVDCTGDADVAYRAGVPCEKGDEQGGMQPPTLMFCMGNVDTEKLRQTITQKPRTYLTDFIPANYFGQNRQFIVVGFRELVEKARKEDGLYIPNDRTIIITGLRAGEAWINMTRVRNLDGTDPRSLTGGEIEARVQIKDIIKYLNKYIPGFENAYFNKMAPFIGIRETRRIVGEYVLNRDDILSCRRFTDAVSACSYPIDIHHANDNDCTLEWSGDCYDIPYRLLVPLKVENLLVAGRCVSATHEALASIRVMAPCMAMGEAAGRAAAIAIESGVTPRRVDVARLRARLIAAEAWLYGMSEARPVEALHDGTQVS